MTNCIWRRTGMNGSYLGTHSSIGWGNRGRLQKRTIPPQPMGFERGTTSTTNSMAPHTVILTVHESTLLLTWLDTVEGAERLTTEIPQPISATTILDCYLQLEPDLRMLHQPFAQQIAISQPEIWHTLFDDELCCHERLLRGQTAWYQLFPLSANVVATSVMQPFIIYNVVICCS